jgi:hypothetical protein
MVLKRKIPSPCQESNPNHPIVQPIANYCTDLDIPAHEGNYICMKNCDVILAVVGFPYKN